jgi:hypothetical protein
VSDGLQANIEGDPTRDARIVVIADPDETCPGPWVDVDADFGYCSLGDQCRNPVPDAHERRSAVGTVDEPNGDANNTE